MARIRKDSTNWNGRKQKAALEGNFPDRAKRAGKSRKDTRAWCKGKVGVEHQYLPVQKSVTETNIPQPFRLWKLECKKCGRRVYRWDDEWDTWLRRHGLKT